MRTRSLLAVVLALDAQTLDPSLPEAARLHAARVGASTMVPQGMVLHRVWRSSAPPPGELEEFIGRRIMRWVVRFDSLVQPFQIHEQVGDRVWARDFTGMVQEQEGPYRAQLLTEDAIRSERWLFGDAKVVEVVRPDGGTLLKVTPSGGVSAMLLISPTGDLLRAQIPADSPIFEISFDHWIADGGVVTPQLVATSRPDGGHAPVVSMLVRSELIPVAPLSPLAGINWHWDGGARRAEIPFEGTIKLEVGGRTAAFMLDTGTDLSVFDADFSKKLGLTPLGPVPGLAGASYAQSPAISVGPAALDSHVVAVTDWRSSAIGPVIPDSFAGLIGAEFLSRVVLIIDYPASRMELRESKSFQPQADDVAIPCERRGSLLFVPARVSGREGQFLVDTGTEQAVVVTHVQDQRGLVTVAEEGFYDPHGPLMVGQTAGDWPAWGDLTLGPFHLKRILLDVFDPSSMRGHLSPGSGWIGTAFWNHFRVTIDLEGNRLWLKQLVPFGEHEGDCTLGMSFARSNGSLTVLSLRKRGPAALAGLHEGDVVRSMDGLAADKLNLAKLPPCKVGERTSLEIVREGKAAEIKVVATPIP
jgi:hypothetical protein